MGSKARCYTWILGAAIVVFPLVLLAQTTVPMTVSIEYRRPYLKLQVVQATSLQVILENVCRNTGFECSGLESARQAIVVPITADGPVEKVIGQLLEGTQLDY